MYETVLNHKFSDLSWLFKAVEIRHHCVHRAGYSKDGEKVDISVESIADLLNNVNDLGKVRISHMAREHLLVTH